MSDDKARTLLTKFDEDAEFRRRLIDAPLEQREAILREEGFGDVNLEHIKAVTHEFDDMQLSDEELAGVAGGVVYLDPMKPGEMLVHILTFGLA